MTVVLVIAGLFALVAFLYVFATERNNKILNAVMVTFGIILPGGFFGLAMNHAFGYQFPVIWWLDIIVGLIDLALLHTLSLSAVRHWKMYLTTTVTKLVHAAVRVVLLSRRLLQRHS